MKQVSKKSDFSHPILHLLPKAAEYYHKYGFFATVQRSWMRLRLFIVRPRTLRTPLFSHHELESQKTAVFPKKLLFSVIVPLYNTPEGFLREMIRSVQEQTYGNWELCLADGSDSAHPEVERICREYASADPRIRYRRLEANLGISGNTNACLELSTGDYISLFDHDDLLHPSALYEVARTICETGADFIYTDEAVFIGDLKHIFTVHCKPDYFQDYLRGNNYICHFTSFSRELLNRVGSFRPEFDGSQDHDFVLRATEKAKKIVHIPEILYYWRSHPNSVAADISSKQYAVDAGIRAVKSHLDRMGISGEVESSEIFPAIYRIRYALTAHPLVSIIIQGRTCAQLRDCLDAVLKMTTYNPVEILAAASDGGEFRECAARFSGVRFVPVQDGLSDGAIRSIAAKEAAGAQLLFLDSSCVPCSPDWVQELLMYAQREDAGVVAGKILDSHDRIAHAGLILGFGNQHTVSCPFLGDPDGSDGYNGRLYYSQEFCAVSPECVMIPRTVWDQAGGFRDYTVPDHYGADLCLRVRQSGYKILWTPYSILKQIYTPRRLPGRILQADSQRFREVWAQALQHTDPCYNPNFIRSGAGFWLK